MIPPPNPSPIRLDPPLPALRVEHPGAFSSIQDLGRPGLRAFGVPAAGAFDPISHTLANALAGNPPQAATLELTLLGGRFQALIPLCLGFAGAPMPLEIESPHSPPRTPHTPGRFLLQPGERLRIGAAPSGHRAYLAVQGGWQTPITLHSRSAESAIPPGATLPAYPSYSQNLTLFTRDTLPSYPPARDPESTPDAPLTLHFLPSLILGMPRAHSLESIPCQVLPDSNRLGIRLSPVHSSLPIPIDPAALSRPVLPGSLQWTGEQLIILGPAGGTLGGYPVLGQIPHAEIHRLAQLRPGLRLTLQPCSHAHARHLTRIQSRWLHQRTLQIQLQSNSLLSHHVH